MQQGDIFWAEMPFSNLEESKLRPVLVVSNNGYNLRSLDVVICALTSNLKDVPYSVPISQASLTEGQLPLLSRVKADKIFQLEKSKIRRRIGRVNDATFELVAEEIGQLLKRA